MKSILVKHKRFIAFVLAFFVTLLLCFSIVGMSANAETLDPTVWKTKDGVNYRIVNDLSTLTEAQPIYYNNTYYPSVALISFQEFDYFDTDNRGSSIPIFKNHSGVILRNESQIVSQGYIIKDQVYNDIPYQLYCVKLTSVSGSTDYPLVFLLDGTTVGCTMLRFVRVSSSTFPIDNAESSEPVKVDFTTNFGANSSSPGSVTSPIDCSYIFDNKTNTEMKIDFQTNYDGYITFYIVRESFANKPVNIANCRDGLFRNMESADGTGVLLKFKQRLVNSAEFPGLVGKVGSILYKDKTLSDNYSKFYDPMPCIAGTPYTLTYPTASLSVNAGQKCALLVVCHPKNQKQFPVSFVQDLNENNVSLCEYDGIVKGGFYGFTMKETVIGDYTKAPYYPVDDKRIFSDDGTKIIDDKGGTGSDGRIIPPNSTTGGGSFYNVTSSAFDFIRGFLDIFPAEIQFLIITGLSIALTIGILRLVTG